MEYNDSITMDNDFSRSASTNGSKVKLFIKAFYQQNKKGFYLFVQMILFLSVDSGMKSFDLESADNNLIFLFFSFF